jgi:hypothetical protein
LNFIIEFTGYLPVEQVLEIIFTLRTLNVPWEELPVEPLTPVPELWPAPAFPEMLPALLPEPAFPLAEALVLPLIPLLELELLLEPLRSEPMIRT